MRGSTTPKARKSKPQSLPTPSSVPASPRASPLSGARGAGREPPSSKIADRDVGFLGSTAFNAVFTENEAHIPISSAIDAEASNVGDQLHDQITAVQNSSLRRGSKDARFVLELLKDFPHLEKITDRWKGFDRLSSIIGPWLHDCQQSIRKDLYEKYDWTNDSSLAVAGNRLTANTERVLSMPNHVRFQDFTSYYTGENLRWEAIGCFLAACGLGLFGLSADQDELAFVGHLEQDKQRLMFRVLEAANACVALCEDAGQGTDLGFWFMVENCVQASQVLGDAHYAVWRKLCDLATAIFARGLHEIDESSGAPFWLQEMRRRGLGCAYACDKTLSTFVGRPPRISKRYCNIRIPLDLSYDELALEGEELAAARSQLDAEGWNTHPTSVRGTPFMSLRVWVLEACICEEVLELNLGPPPENLRARALDILRRCKELSTSIPVSLRYSPETWVTHETGISFQAIICYLDHTYNEFMLRRMLVRRFRDDPTELLLLAHKILAAVIEARHLRGIGSSNAACISWIIVLNGLPAAGVLALELLQLNVRVIPHGKIKQDLCAFISCLQGVHVPGEGNWRLADRARKTLQHIMDRVLDTSPSVEQQQQQLHLQQQRANAAATFPGDVAGDPGITDDLGLFDFSWLDANHSHEDFWDGLISMDYPMAT